MPQQSPDIKDAVQNLLLISLLSLWLYWLWSRRSFYQFAYKFPGSFGFPFIGSVLSFKDILHIVGTTFERCKTNTVCIWTGLHPAIVSKDPELIAKVLSSPDFLDKPAPLYNALSEAIQNGIIVSPSSIWQHNRKLINPAFQHKILVSFLPVFINAKNVVLSKFDKMVDNGEYKLCDMLQRAALGVTVQTTMGKKMEPGDQVDEEVASNYSFLMDKITTHIMLSTINLGPLHACYRKYQTAKKYNQKFVAELVKEKLKKINIQTQQESDKNEATSIESIKKSSNIFIDLAIENYRKKKFSFKDIIAESNSIVVASFETTSDSTSFALFMLATHPTVQELLYQEIVNILPDKNIEIEFDHLAQLPYLDMVINETLRLAPALPLIARQLTKDLTMSENVVLPRNMQFIISIFHLHRREDIWGANAHNFDPDNFLPENVARRHPYSFMPFSKGMRNCIGWRYALISLKIMLIGIVRNYRLTTSMRYEDIAFTYGIALKYLNEPSFKIHRRE